MSIDKIFYRNSGGLSTTIPVKKSNYFLWKSSKFAGVPVTGVDDGFNDIILVN
jgi:hypothetical protein